MEMTNQKEREVTIGLDTNSAKYQNLDRQLGTLGL